MSKKILEWVITRECNLNCWYCNDWFKSGSHTIINESTIAEIKQYDLVKIIGGEPTIHPQYKSIISKLVKQNKNVSVQTNLINIKNIENIGETIIPSYHHKKILPEKFMSRILALNTCIDEINIMWEADYNDDIIKVYNKTKKMFSDKEVNLRFTLPNKMDEWEEMIEAKKFKLHGYNSENLEIMLDGGYRWKGNRCKINKYVKYIREDGINQFCITKDVNASKNKKSSICDQDICLMDMGLRK